MCQIVIYLDISYKFKIYGNDNHSQQRRCVNCERLKQAWQYDNWLMGIYTVVYAHATVLIISCVKLSNGNMTYNLMLGTPNFFSLTIWLFGNWSLADFCSRSRSKKTFWLLAAPLGQTQWCVRWWSVCHKFLFFCSMHHNVCYKILIFIF